MTVLGVQINVENGQVNGRDLWKWLESKKDFSSWVKQKVKHLNLRLTQDFTPNGGNTRQEGRPQINYLFTTEAAKKIAMAENTEQGNRVRDYFLAMEKVAVKVITEDQFNFDSDPIIAIRKSQIMMEQRLKKVEEKFEQQEIAILQAQEEMKLLPAPTKEVKEPTLRKLLNKAIWTQSKGNPDKIKIIWAQVYQYLLDCCGKNVAVQAANRGLKPIDIIEHENLLEDSYSYVISLNK